MWHYQRTNAHSPRLALQQFMTSNALYIGFSN